MRRARAALCLVVVLVASACGGKGGGGAAPEAPKAAVPWAVGTATVELPPPPSGPGEPPMNRPIISSVVWTPDGYRASGTTASGFAVWKSTDGLDWKIVHNESRPCCDRYENAMQLYRYGDQLIAISGGETRLSSTGDAAKDLANTAFLRSSSDNGATWTEHVGGPFGTPGLRIDTVDVDGSNLLVAAVTEEANFHYRPSLWRTTDLVAWQALDLPGAPELGFRAVTAAPDGSITASATDMDTNTQHWFRSRDNGASFAPVDGPARAFVLGRAGGRLIARIDTDVSGDRSESQSQPVVATTTDGSTWPAMPRNSGLWGDGDVDLRPPVSTRDASYLLVGRTVRQDNRYCFDDIATCQQPERVLLRVDDGAAFTQVNVTVDPEVRDIVAGDDGSVLLWNEHQLEFGKSELRITRWAGPDAPATSGAPQPLPPPSDLSPVLLNNYTSVAVGDTFRARRDIGACGGNRLEVGGRYFVDANPPQEPYPSSWPFKPFNGSDGPTGYLFVKGDHPDADAFRFFVDATTTLEYRFDPNGAPTQFC